jgi:hypothetical protein
MSLRFFARIVFVIAMAFTLSTPLLGTAAACDDVPTGYC